MTVAVGVADLPDEIQNPLPLGQVGIDLHIPNIPQSGGVHRPNVHILHGFDLFLGINWLFHVLPPLWSKLCLRGLSPFQTAGSKPPQTVPSLRRFVMYQPLKR